MNETKLTLFNRTKYESNLRKLEARNAPNYIIEAYNRGLVGMVNEYYKRRLQEQRGLLEQKYCKPPKVLMQEAKNSGIKMMVEAYKKKDLDFLNLLYQMTNIDILTKHKKIPANAGQLIKQGEILDLGLTKLHKRLR